MSRRLENSVDDSPRPTLSRDFTVALAQQLQEADRARKAYVVRRWAQRALLLALLLGPLLAWRLVTGAGDAHLAIDGLSWLTFVLNVCVRVDSGVLGYLQLQALPSITGGVLLILVTVGLLRNSRGDD